MEKVDIYNLNYPDSLRVANILSNQYRYEDPLPDVEPSLLNKVDIARYVARTGMVHEFNPNQLKPASYEVKLGNEILFWDENGNRQHHTNIGANIPIRIRQNSITYVGVETRFYLPFYIALRFNLTITHVHRGLLLGTGPLIDPGFRGNLMIPIHNLTTNDYFLRPRDPLIAVEFTKLSKDKWLAEEQYEITSKYENNVKKPNATFDDYINMAIKPHASVESSLEQVLGKAEKEIERAKVAIDEAKKESKRIFRIITVASIIGAVALIIAAASAIYQTQSLILDSNKYVSDSTNITRDNIEKTKQLIFEQQQIVNLLSQKITNIENELKNRTIEEKSNEHLPLDAQ